jgi:hypothetical protein
LLHELFYREQRMKVSEWELTLRTLGQFLGLSQAAAKAATLTARDEYEKIATGAIFELSYLQARLREHRDRLKEQRRMTERLDRIPDVTKLATVRKPKT